jgi:hypothetical protein
VRARLNKCSASLPVFTRRDRQRLPPPQSCPHHLCLSCALAFITADRHTDRHCHHNRVAADPPHQPGSEERPSRSHSTAQERNMSSRQQPSRLSTAPSSIKPRQLVCLLPLLLLLSYHLSITSSQPLTNNAKSHLHAQLAQLSANLADLENLLRMTSVQAECVRGLGGWHGGL